MPRLAFLTWLPLLAVAGCLGSPIDPKLEASAAYQTGYGDGCATSTARSRTYDRTVTRDQKSYETDALYRRGWNTGFRQCGSSTTQGDPYAAPSSPDWKNRGPLS